MKFAIAFLATLLFVKSVFALEEPPGTKSLDDTIREEQAIEADRLAAYEKEYSNYRVKPHETALILLHGKWGSPPAPQASAFINEKFHVISPVMPWAGARGYDITYEAALLDINKTVQQLKSDGYRKIVLGGQSFGSNGALAYAAAYGDIDGLILFAPGHNPDIDWNGQPRIVSLAKDAIKEGKPETKTFFTDYNDGGRTRRFEARADVFVSFFAEDGPANMSLSATKIQKPIPTIVFMSSEDFVTRKGSGYFFDKMPKHEKSRYNVLSAGHREVPAVAFKSALSWLKDLMR